MSGNHVLDALPGLRGDEWFVATRILDAAIADEALVVRVLEQLVQV
jgi:hypothetical protein